MGVIKDNWENMQIEASTETYLQLQRAYYAGAEAAFNEMLRIADSAESVEEGQACVEELRTELVDFSNAVERGEA